ncbi:MAG: CsbD family protein [Hyphomonas sp.]|uniref:CsbD family protein n=1 Tax=Hyphomonas sp. TaxID=87 RepID=UPI0018585595|nr:CsbD family protein [Hyphomonas sp.]MBA3068878.1 CsbD family protein [Hyphomonas sp.]MBU3920047.1 CsbD family protein [Alphaproteobacteria bacterium]MBU4062910.1 CsbD family protein [Alphaproteobacteria bacterium]MBU4165442.1 CsbD family protein [Alphaproteobacteria bacterium]
MDKEHLKGAAKKAEGQIKETAGKLTGDKKLEIEGKAKKVEGEVRQKLGDVKDALKK